MKTLKHLSLDGHIHTSRPPPLSDQKRRHAVDMPDMVASAKPALVNSKAYPIGATEPEVRDQGARIVGVAHLARARPAARRSFTGHCEPRILEPCV